MNEYIQTKLSVLAGLEKYGKQIYVNKIMEIKLCKQMRRQEPDVKRRSGYDCMKLKYMLYLSNKLLGEFKTIRGETWIIIKNQFGPDGKPCG